MDVGGRARTGRGRALIAAALAGALAGLAGCTSGGPVPSGTPTGTPSATGQPAPSAPADGVRVVPVASIPDVQVPDQLEVVAGTGNRFLISPGWNGGQGRYTPDDGGTWNTLAEVGAFDEVFGGVLGYGGEFIRLRMSEDEKPFWSGFQVWDPEGGLTDLVYDLSPDIPEEDGDYDIGVDLVDYIGSAVLLRNPNSRIFDISGAAPVPIEVRVPAGIDPEKVSWKGLTRDGRHVAGSSGDRLVVGALDEGGTPAAIPVPGLLDVDVSADRVHYLVASASRVQVCRAEATTLAKPHCATVTKGDYRGSKRYGLLSTSDGADQVLLGERRSTERGRVWQEHGWLVREDRATQVWSVPLDQGEFWRWLPYRDAAQPMALVTQRKGAPDHVVAFDDEGEPSELFVAPAAAAQAGEIRPTSDRVVYQQRRVSPAGELRWFVWQRPLLDGQLGAESLLADSESSNYRVSGGRTVVDLPPVKKTKQLVFFDDHRQTASIDPGSPPARDAGRRHLPR